VSVGPGRDFKAVLKQQAWMVGWGMAGVAGWLGKRGRLEYQRGTNHGGGAGLADGKPRAAGWKYVAVVGCATWPRGGRGGAFGCGV
jgi:hypothetical protein